MPRSTPGNRAPGITKAQQQAFLRAFAETGIIRDAAEAANIHRCTHWRWLQDPEYAAAYEAATAEAADRIEREALRRALEGWEEPVFQGGKQVGTVRKFDSRLLELLLKAHKPERFRERHQVDQNTTVTVRSELDAELDRLVAGLGGGERPVGQSPDPVEAPGQT